MVCGRPKRRYLSERRRRAAVVSQGGKGRQDLLTLCARSRSSCNPTECDERPRAQEDRISAVVCSRCRSVGYSTVQDYFYAWSHQGLLAQINHMLVMALREKVGRQASPSAGVIDSQSVKTTECGGPRGFDAGKKIKGRKRHIVTDTEGIFCAGYWVAL
jgi:transposase